MAMVSEARIVDFEKNFQQSLIFQKTINDIYRISFLSIPLEQQLKMALESILHIPWLFVQSRGAIFLADENTRQLTMQAHKGLSGDLLRTCAIIPFGQCMCGKTAETRSLQHAENMDSKHDIRIRDMEPHGHYVVPLLSGEKLLGVLNLYLESGHSFRREETELLKALASTLASLIARKEAEQQLLNNNLDLEARVQERTQELQEHVDSLHKYQKHMIRSERMAALGGLVAGIAHEINTPIGIGYTAATHLEERSRVLERRFQDGLLTRDELTGYMADLREACRLIVINLGRAGDLINGFKRVAVDQTSQEKRSFALRSYLEEILLSLHPKLKKSPHSVTLHCPEEIRLTTYPGALSQILTNLILNALIHAFPDQEHGNITIEVCEEESNMILLSFQDDGQGMTPELLKQIFEPFITTRRNQGGSGLGLYVVYNQVTQKLCGTIHCESQPGHGAKFLIRFPARL
ncbi:MAG: ATP-binding protein [Magnetococcus sp. DMHC-1]|nr:GAF domain-containing protein [Magnetococcales bacterium]